MEIFKMYDIGNLTTKYLRNKARMNGGWRWRRETVQFFCLFYSERGADEYITYFKNK